MNNPDFGKLNERTLHAMLKRQIEPDPAYHEIPCGRFIVDVKRDREIFEIQTADLYPMRKKIEFYMTQTDHPVTVVHPLIGKKQILWLRPEGGEVTPARSPLREGVLHGVAQLKAFIPYLCNGRFHLVFPVIEAEEYRLLDGWGKGGKRGSHRYELIPLSLLDTVVLRDKADYVALFPDDARLDTPFTAGIFGKVSRLVGYALYDALAVFEALGVIEKCGKAGRAALYQKMI